MRHLSLPVVKVVGVVGLSVLVGLVAWLVGALDPGRSGDERTARATAEVVVGASCGDNRVEEVTYRLDNQRHQATLDACGHQEGETVEVAVPEDSRAKVHLAEARTGGGVNTNPIALLLISVAGVASAVFADRHLLPGRGAVSKSVDHRRVRRGGAG